MAAPDRDVVLLVEDDPNDQLLIRRSFKKAATPTRIAAVEDGDEAIAYLSGLGSYADRRRFPAPGVVMLDLKLPRRSGLEVLAWIRAQEAVRQVPVLVLTSSHQDIDIRQAYELGANSYLVKPVDLADLETMIARVAEYWTILNYPPPPWPG